jgi:hypothetical protein
MKIKPWIAGGIPLILLTFTLGSGEPSASVGRLGPAGKTDSSKDIASRGIHSFCRFFKEEAGPLPLTPAERSDLLDPRGRSEAIFKHLGRIITVLFPALAQDGDGLGQVVARALAQSLREVPEREAGIKESALESVLRSAGFYSRKSSPQFRRAFRPLGRKVRGNWALKALSVPGAHAIARGRGTRVAVIDSGIDPTIKEIRGKIRASLDLLDGGSGPDPAAFPFDWGGHGTAVTSVVSQVAPQADLLIIKVTDNETMRDSLVTRWNVYIVAAGIRWAARNGADIISLSVALPFDPEDSLRRAVLECRSRGILFVAAAGNVQEGERPGEVRHLPGSYPGVVGVGGVELRNGSLRIWPHSATGPSVDFVAPAAGIWVESPSYLESRPAVRISEGTSLAVPAVAGAAALVLSALKPDMKEKLRGRPGGLAREIERILILSASNDFLETQSADPLSGFGLIDCQKAVRIAASLER